MCALDVARMGYCSVCLYCSDVEEQEPSAAMQQAGAAMVPGAGAAVEITAAV